MKLVFSIILYGLASFGLVVALWAVYDARKRKRSARTTYRKVDVEYERGDPRERSEKYDEDDERETHDVDDAGRTRQAT